MVCVPWPLCWGEIHDCGEWVLSQTFEFTVQPVNPHHRHCGATFFHLLVRCVKGLCSDGICVLLFDPRTNNCVGCRFLTSQILKWDFVQLASCHLQPFPLTNHAMSLRHDGRLQAHTFSFCVRHHRSVFPSRSGPVWTEFLVSNCGFDTVNCN